jgi:hypothetical protein
MHVNDHYEFGEPDEMAGGDEIVATLLERFDGSIRRSEWIIDQIMKLKR